MQLKKNTDPFFCSIPVLGNRNDWSSQASHFCYMEAGNKEKGHGQMEIARKSLFF